jgi:murein L,D-transpeptidase YafK
MKIETSESFFESLERLAWYDTKLWKVWEFIKRTIPRFFKNIWRFRKELASHEWWDYRYTLEMLYRSLSIMVVKLEKDGIEEDASRMKKVVKIKRALELLKHKLDDDYVERAEKELGELYSNPWEFEPTEDGNYRLIDNDTEDEKEHNSKVFKLTHKLEDKEWIELWNILKGTRYSKTWGDKFDGTDMRGWWD